MNYHQQQTIARRQKALAGMIVDIMRSDDLSLLEAYVKLASMATSDEVVELAKQQVLELNGVGA